MRIAFNPSTVAALIAPPNNKDITFDLRGHNIFARGVKFCGTDTWRPVVDNLTSDSTTSSLSANLGRVLKALIDGKSDSGHTHDDRYVKKTGDTMLGALNFANGTWNLVGDDSYMGDCNVSGHFGIKAANTTYPGISFFNNANDHLGNLTAYNGNIKYGAYSLQFLDNGNTSVSASTWTNPFSDYNSNAVADGQAVCVWGQSSLLSNLANDTGDMSLWLRRVNANVATLNMVLDGEYYANGSLRLAHVSEIPNSLKNPYALTISLNGTSQGPYDGSAAKNINITPSSIGAATSDHNHINYLSANGLISGNIDNIWTHGTYGFGNRSNYTGTLPGNSNYGGFLVLNPSATTIGTYYTTQIALLPGYFGYRIYDDHKWYDWKEVSMVGHNHDGRYVRYYAVTTLDCNNLAVGLTAAKVSATNAAHTNHSAFLYISNVGTPFQIQIPDSSVPYIYKRYYSSGTWSGWFKLNAGYADSAGNADTIDGLHYSSFLRKDTNDSTPYQYTFTKTDGHAIKVGTIRGTAVGSQTGDYIHLYERVAIGSPSGWGSRSAPSYGLATYGGAWLATDTGNVGIGTTVPIQKLHVNGSVFLGKTDLDNTPFTDSLQILANSGNESYNENFNESNQSFGITFIRDWKTGGYRTKQGGIYSVGSGSWRAGLAFRVKNNTTENGTHDITAMWISPVGNVGIGTTSPQMKLHVNGNGIYLNSTATCGINMYSSHSESSISYKSKDGIRTVFGTYTNRTFLWNESIGEHVSILSSNGYFGIGTTTPAYKLDVNGQIRSSFASNNGNPCIMVNPTNDTDWCYGIEVLATKLTAGHRTGAYWAGKANSTNNAICMSYYHEGDGSRDNRLIWHTWGSGDKMMLTADGRVGIGATPSYKLDVNGDIWCRGALRVGSSATNNYIAFYGNTGDAPGSFVTSFIGEHLWGGDESTELLLMKFNDVGNGISGTTVSGPGPDRIRHIAHAHVFLIMTDSSLGDFATMAATTAVETKLDITRNRITASVPLYLQSDLHVNGILQFHVTEAHIGHDSGYSDPWGGLTVNFKFGGTLAATHIYSNGGFHKNGSNDNYVLLGGGGHKALSDFASATKLQTPRSLWGQSFDGTADVNGTIYINNSNSSNGAIRLNNDINSNARISAISDQVIFNTGSAIRFGETDWDFNKWAGLKYTHSNKTIYLGIADNSIFNANSALSGGTLNLRAGISNIDLNSGTSIRGLPTDGSPYSSSITLMNSSIDLSTYGNISILSSGPGTIKLTTGYGSSASISSDIKIGSSKGVYLNSGNSGNVWLCLGGGNVSIGYSSPSYKLDVNGLMRSDGFHHYYADSNDYVLLAGGGYSKGVLIKYWSIDSINIRSTSVSRTHMGGNYDFISSIVYRINGSCELTLRFPSGYNGDNTIIWAMGTLNHDISNSNNSNIYATILHYYGSTYYLNLADDNSLNNGACNLYFICF